MGWSEKYLERFKAEHGGSLEGHEMTEIEGYSIELPVEIITDQFTTLWSFVSDYRNVMEHAKLDFPGWMERVVGSAIWRRAEVEGMLFEAEFSKQSAFAIRLKLYEAIIRVNPALDWKQLRWDHSVLQLICGIKTDTTEEPVAPGAPEMPARAGAGLSVLDPVLAQDLEVRLKEQIRGQSRAIKVLANAMRRASVGFGRQKQRPIGAFLFAGPTGVGKTETAKALAECLMGGNLITVNCTEYQQPHEISKLFGAPPGYAGFEDKRDGAGMAPATLVSRIKKTPSSVVLFDEIEKAHETLNHALLRLLDEGIMTSGRGEDISFKNAVIIMTSNIGVREARSQFQTRKMGFGGDLQEKDYIELQARVIVEAIAENFSPEFRNRLSAVVVFDPIDSETAREIVIGLLHGTGDLLKSLHNISLDWSDDVVDFVAQRGLSEEFGCRDLERAIRDLVEQPITDLIIKCHIPSEEETGRKFVPGESLRGAKLEMYVGEGEMRFKRETRIEG